MKFIYEYRTRDNVKHSGVLNAYDRDSAYAALKAQGVNPSRMVEAPGFFNKLFGKGKRWVVIGTLSVAVVGTTMTTIHWRKVAESDMGPMHRHQIYGDPVLMDELSRNGYVSVFEAEGDRFLARFAQPGVYVTPLEKQERQVVAGALARLRDAKSVTVDGGPREVRELKRIVMWIRNELAQYLENGVGTCDTYIKRLYERQNREVMIYNRAVHQLEKSGDEAEFARVNESLRKLGLRTVLKAEKSNETADEKRRRNPIDIR